MTYDYDKWLESGAPRIFCKCACMEEIIIKEHHQRYGIPEYIWGHHSRGRHMPQHQKLILSERMKVDNPTKKLDVRLKISQSRKGIYVKDKCPAWRGGISKLPYCERWTEEKREEIRNQYNRKCFNCGKDEKDNVLKNGKQEKLCVHHVDNDKDQGCNGKEWKLIPLCKSCHSKAFNKRYIL